MNIYKNKNKGLLSGFTLIELLVVIAIIGILTGILIVSINSVRSLARDARRKIDIKNMVTALQMYYIDNEQYPLLFSGPGTAYCSALTSAPVGWLSPYMSTIPTDPLWAGYPYTYEFCQRYSSGRDRQTYTLWARLEASSGNVDPAIWPVGGYRPSGYKLCDSKLATLGPSL